MSSPPSDANRPDASPFPTCDLLGMTLACTDRDGLLDHIFASLNRGIGGWLVTANLDFLRRYVRDTQMRDLYALADVRVADGMPLLWAARIQGDRFPERLAGSDLIWLIAERAARESRTIYLLGGDPSANAKAADVLRQRWPALTICGHSSPMVHSPPSMEETAALQEEMIRTRPHIVLVGMGSPKQEQVIQTLRAVLPQAWMTGLGASFSFVAGDIRRAPVWMRRSGLEWMWRLGQEPRRLARRYLLEDLPFFFELLGSVISRRVRRGSSRP